MARLALVSCSAQKLEHAAPACELYCSQLFVKARRVAELAADRWCVLSARHGLVRPEQVLEPYDERLPAGGSESWSWRVFEQLLNAGELRAGDRLLWLAGRSYSRHLAEIANAWPQHDPMQGMQVGERLAWLTRAGRSAVTARLACREPEQDARVGQDTPKTSRA